MLKLFPLHCPGIDHELLGSPPGAGNEEPSDAETISSTSSHDDDDEEIGELLIPLLSLPPPSPSLPSPSSHLPLPSHLFPSSAISPPGAGNEGPSDAETICERGRDSCCRWRLEIRENVGIQWNLTKNQFLISLGKYIFSER